MIYDNYISFLYHNQDLQCVFIKHFMGYVEIKCNKPELVRLVCFDECLSHTLPERGIVTGQVWIYVEPDLFGKRVTRDDYDSDSFTPKTNAMYVEGTFNKSFLTSDSEIMITHYPFPRFSIFRKDSCCYYSVVTDSYDFIVELRSGIKKCLACYYLKYGIIPLHAAAASRDNFCDIFLASTRCGKSTLYANLVSSGFAHVGDDIVFVRPAENGLETFSVPILPSIRERAKSYLSNKSEIYTIRIRNEDNTELRVLRLKNLAFHDFDTIKVYSISKLIMGKFSSDTIIAPDYSIKKALIKSVMWHLKTIPIEEMLTSINALLRLKWYCLSLSVNPDENVDIISKRREVK